MTLTSANPVHGGLRVRVQRFGAFLSGMVMPNIAAFIAWGLLTALFIPSGWLPLLGINAVWVQQLGGWSTDPAVTHLGLVNPMITYLLPLLIAHTGGRMVYGVRGGVVGTIATMGVIVGAGIPMFLGAMVMGPLSAWLMKKVDALWGGTIKPGFEMLVNNFSAGIMGLLLALLAFVGIAPLVVSLSAALSAGVRSLVTVGLLPLTSVVIEPAKILFLNNAINHGILTPLGVQQEAEAGTSVLFLLEANPGPGMGVLLAYAVCGVGVARASAPGAAIIHFLGGIHEIYFPYVLMKPTLVTAVILGGATGVATNVAFNSGLRAPASPGSIIAVLVETAHDSLLGVVLSVVAATTVSFVVASVIIRSSRAHDLAADYRGENVFGAAVAANEANKGAESAVATLLDSSGAKMQQGVAAPLVRTIVVACDAGMGSSAMGASVLRHIMTKAGYDDVTVTNRAIAELEDDVDLVITQKELTERARERVPGAIHVSVDNFMNSAQYNEVVALVARQHAIPTDP
ncbi:PTS mannitol transporter subunit IICB [Rathayibacter toxicus]|uniref:PTS system mannitol-specific EIICB component n=1 Tax=Rathayibacter toxicus TaxID=145458 RepID=A0A0C5BDX6_9MICO|nr:PTS mannitol transporter subunit IICBA [Rathayibacter toxicus]AJM77179.1 PTS mannitol transporter subunit IIB [Rathayibacter toxicus]ALS56975.1 PTS mannitol transporter subunit IIB [Rathayibacter toxicus]KKM46195.1 PTS mannitol transporter subunit IIB [Rathayibacter toxicus]PPG23149.1 PTS mannitol transporter subunit IICBA [Rathayibacter toxicus]PPG47732.1 PTS mannitol transporter subunit IICBA [Rathayibacter toxicus]